MQVNTKHNINIAEHPELYNVIVLTRTKEEWDDVIQYDPNSGLESRHLIIIKRILLFTVKS